MLMPLDNFKPLVEGLDHPECPAWGLDGNFYAGGEAGQIYRISPDGNYKELANTGGVILGVCLDGRGNVYACDSKRHSVMKISPDGGVEEYTKGSSDRPMGSPNGLVFDRHGNLYVTDSGEQGKNNGCLYRVSPGGQAEVVSTGLCENPNGLAIDPSGQYLYVVLSAIYRVSRVSLPDGPTGELGAPETIVTFEKVVPDGLAFDTDGSLYIGCDTPNVIYRHSPGGKLEVLVEDWKRETIASPTNLAFGGDDMRTLVVANFSRWGLVKVKMDRPGAPLNYPIL